MRMLILILGVCLEMNGMAQVRYVVPGGAGTKDGISWANAMVSVAEALEQATTVFVGMGTYELEKEITVPEGKILSGGWNPVTNLRVENFAAKTVLRAKGLHRVVKIAGRLEGVTVEKGVAIQGKGGGVYITSTGVVENCIIRDNVAAQYYPKVGDVYCNDGQFLTKEDINAGNVGKIEGLVFWVNPDPDALQGQRGWIAKLEYLDYYGEWSTGVGDENPTGHVCCSVLEALADTAGYTYTQNVKKNAGNIDDYPAVKYCGEGWYLPAFGQLRRIMTELKWLEETVKVINRLKGKNGTYWDILSSYWSSSEGVSESGNKQVWCLGNYDGGGGISLVDKWESAVILPIKSF